MKAKKVVTGANSKEAFNTCAPHPQLQQAREDEVDESRVTIGIAASVNRTGSTLSRQGQHFLAFMLGVHTLSVIGLWMTICLTAVAAHAQNLAANSGPTVSATFGNGWWSRPWTGATSAVPHSDLSKAYVLDSVNSFSVLPPSTIKAVNHHLGNNESTTVAGFESGSDLRPESLSSSAVYELVSPESFFSLLQAKYISWVID